MKGQHKISTSIQIQFITILNHYTPTQHLPASFGVETPWRKSSITIMSFSHELLRLSTQLTTSTPMSCKWDQHGGSFKEAPTAIKSNKPLLQKTMEDGHHRRCPMVWCGAIHQHQVAWVRHDVVHHLPEVLGFHHLRKQHVPSEESDPTSQLIVKSQFADKQRFWAPVGAGQALTPSSSDLLPHPSQRSWAWECKSCKPIQTIIQLMKHHMRKRYGTTAISK